VVKNIIDIDHTLNHVTNLLQSRRTTRLPVCALLDNPTRREVTVNVDIVGFEIEDRFAVGYGIDYAQRNRNLPYIGTVRLID